MDKTGDVSIRVDAAMAAAHLIGLEEHLAATAAMADDPHIIPMIHRVREARKSMLGFIVGDTPPGELWCASKHTLGAWMRIKEVGDKLASYEDVESKAIALEMYQMAASMEHVLKQITTIIAQYKAERVERCSVCIE